MPRGWSGIDALTAGFQTLCPLCERQVGVYYLNGDRLYWAHAGKEGQCPKSNTQWTQIGDGTWTVRYHERPTNAGKGWKP